MLPMCRIRLYEEAADDVVHMLKTDPTIDWLSRLNL